MSSLVATTVGLRKRVAEEPTLTTSSTVEIMQKRAKLAEQNAVLLDSDSNQAWQNLDDLEKVSVDAGKALEEFRNYKDSSRQDIVELHYQKMREHQTVAKVDYFYKKYHSFDHDTLTIWEGFEALKGYVDSSDPDSDLPNLEHMLQTAESIRAAGHPDWFVLTGLLHDMGKIMYRWGTEADGQIGEADFPQWALGGDTWVVGVAIPQTAVFPQFNSLNPDARNHPEYQRESTVVGADGVVHSRVGMYEKHCGLSNLTFAYGHDEYMYQMLRYNKTTLPKEGLAMIRYHSCCKCRSWVEFLFAFLSSYSFQVLTFFVQIFFPTLFTDPLHSCGEYKNLLEPGDEELLEWVREFNQFDLYTKADEKPNIVELWPYYQRLIDKYIPGKLKW